MFSVKDWQRAALARMLVDSSASSAASSAAASARLDDEDGGAAASSSSAAWSDDWKVLVLDADTRSIVAPLLTVGELRSLAVTLHLAIDAPRDCLPDVAAVYFLRPTPQNVAAVAADAAAGRYRDASVHFCSPVPRAVLEDFARACVEAGCVARVRRVCDQHLSFIALEPRLFTLNMRRSFVAYQSPAAANANDGEAVRNFARTVATGLLGVFGTVGAVPVIVFATGGPAELVARDLDELMREHLASPGLGAFGAGSGGAGALPVPLPGRRRPEPLGFGAGARPVLLLVDRDLAPAAPLAHCSTYQGLVDDCFGPISLNRVLVPDADSENGGDSAAAEAAATAASAAAAGGASGFLTSALGALWGAASGSASDRDKAKAKGKTVYLDSDADPFWRNHACDDFHRAVESQEAEAKDAAACEEALRRSRAAAGGAGAASLADEAAVAAALALGAPGPDASAADLLSAINSVPELLKRKRMLEAHAGVLTALFRVALESRQMNRFAEAEAAALQGPGAAMERRDVLRLCGEGGPGRAFEDRLRLAAIHLLTCSATGGGGGGGAGSGAGGGGAGGGGAGAGAMGAGVGAGGAIGVGEGGGGGSSGGSPAAALEGEEALLLQALRASLSAEAEGGEASSAAAAGGGTGAASAAAPSAKALAASAAAAAHMQRASAVLAYVRHLRGVAAAAAGGFGSGSGGGGGGALGGFSLSQAVGGGTGGALLDAGGRLFGNILSAASSVARSAARGAARLVAGEARMPVTRLVQAVCEGRPALAAGLGLEGFGVLDPRVGGLGQSRQPQPFGAFIAAASAAAAALAAGMSGGGGGGVGGGSSAGGGAVADAAATAGASAAAQFATFRNAFVFVVGGGCYGEAHDVWRYAAQAEPRRTVVYGATELVNARTFLDELEELGKEVKGGRP